MTRAYRMWLTIALMAVVLWGERMQNVLYAVYVSAALSALETRRLVARLMANLDWLEPWIQTLVESL